MENSGCGVHKIVADVAVLAEGRVLLVRYEDASRYDSQKGWFLPDDFVSHLEHPDEAARRILKEQANLSVRNLALGEIESFGDGAWHLVFHYRVGLDTIPESTRGANVAALEWFPLDKLPPRSDVAHHGWALDVLRRITGSEGR